MEVKGEVRKAGKRDRERKEEGRRKGGIKTKRKINEYDNILTINQTQKKKNIIK
jgi:hypothetical protein